MMGAGLGALILVLGSTASPPAPHWELWSDAPILAPPARATPSALVVDVTPADDIQALSERHPEGVTFRLAPGVYRNQGYTPPKSATERGDQPVGLILKNNTRLEAAVRRTAIFRGSKPVTAVASTPGLWTITGLELQDNSTQGECKPEFPACNLRQDLFQNSLPLKRELSLSNVTAGSRSWFLDYELGVATVAVSEASNLEFSWVQTVIAGNCQGGPCFNVTVDGLVAENFGNHAQCNVFEGAHSVNDCEVRYNHGTGVGNMIVTNSYVHHNGQIGGGGRQLTEGNVFAFNNNLGYSEGWEAGGAKFVVTGPPHLVVRGNSFLSNNGPGIWTDCDSIGVTYEDNILLNNSGPGIFHEISFGATIRNNHAEGNCWPANLPFCYGGHCYPGPNTGSFCGQISLSSSGDTVISGNTIITTGLPGANNGITLYQQGDRGVGVLGPRLLRNVSVHSNTIVAQTCGGRNGIVDFSNRSDGYPTPLLSGVRFDNNTYVQASTNPISPGSAPNNTLRGSFWWCDESLPSQPNQAKCGGWAFGAFRSKFGQEAGGKEFLGSQTGKWCGSRLHV